jgi:hypothetical protein
MALPEFTGDASFYRSATQYHMAAPIGVLARGAAIPPFTWTCGPCTINGRQLVILLDREFIRSCAC